ncbi:MAG: triose-phosphate isomerase [Candidatus Yonathbacteria bacterium]|nr:triose-phosphate isomerase [Candidatus Yonathbacteria bacterium]
MKKKKIIVGNWKMAPLTLEEAKKTFTGIKKTASKLRNVDTVVCPPFVFATELANRISGKRCSVGGQNTFWKEEGAYTGEVSSTQLYSLGARYVILGHSERRAMGETDEMVSKKADASLRAGLTAIICVGEQFRDQHGEYTKRIEEQLKQSLSGIQKKSLENIIIAYEPVWAIGAHAVRPASPEDVLEVSILIRKVLTNMFDRESSHVVPILYGGSVDEKNCERFMVEGGADGLLVGRASLNAKQFGEILKVAEQSAKKK